MCWLLISSEPTEDPTGQYRTFGGPHEFQTPMMSAPFADGCTTCLWFCGQFIPLTCGCTQYMLRRKILNGDMSKYVCFQGYFDVCCFKAGSCGEQNCPDLCLCCESCCCNFAAISASRIYVMEKFDLSSDPCDYRLIRINNAIQLLSCICNIMAIFISDIRNCARVLDYVADIVYHSVSGCMTAQVAHEMNFQLAQGTLVEAIVVPKES